MFRTTAVFTFTAIFFSCGTQQKDSQTPPDNIGSDSALRLDSDTPYASTFQNFCTEIALQPRTSYKVTLPYQKYDIKTRTTLWENRQSFTLTTDDNGVPDGKLFSVARALIGGKEQAELNLEEQSMSLADAESKARILFSRSLKITEPSKPFYGLCQTSVLANSISYPEPQTESELAFSMINSGEQAWNKLQKTISQRPEFASLASTKPVTLFILPKREAKVRYKDSQDNKIKTLLIADVDNLAYRTGYKGLSFETHQIVAFPHSHAYQQAYWSSGQIWNNPLVVMHEFSHHIFGQILETQNSMSASVSAVPWSSRRLTASLNRVLFQTHLLIDAEDSNAPPASPPVPLATETRKQNLIKAIAYTQRAWHEALADLMGAALEGSYNGFGMRCLGQDRHPGFSNFGLGRFDKVIEKKIPTNLRLYDFQDTDSWNSILNNETEAKLTKFSDCSKSPLTLKSPYTLASILTHWFEDAVKLSYGEQSFPELEETLRLHTVLTIAKELKKCWKNITLLEKKREYTSDHSADWKSISYDELIEASASATLQFSLVRVIAAAFPHGNQSKIQDLARIVGLLK